MVLKTKTNPAVISAVAEAATGAGYEALRFLSQQGLDHTPPNFSLAWQLKTDRRSVIAMAIDAILMEGRRLTQTDVDRITAAHASQSKGSDAATGSRQDSLRHQTLRLADIAAGAASQSSDFGRDLSTGLFQLSGGQQSVEQIVKAMVQRTHRIQDQLTAASGEIEDLRQQVEISRDDAHRDALIGLLNRRGARKELSPRRALRKGAVALCDIDHFKLVNDRFGHGVGDRVLKAVGECLVESLADHIVARWGGEEFLVILDGIVVEEAVHLLQHARHTLEQRSFRSRESNAPIGTITMSIGVSTLEGMSPDDAIEAADRRLYDAKRHGRNQVVYEDRGISNA